LSDQSTSSGSSGESAARPRVLLVVHDDSPRSVALPDQGELVLGRADDASLRIEATSLSRRHARFVVGEEGALTVEDLASHNGTRVGGVAIAPSTPLPLLVGDVVECGGVLVLVGRGGGEPAQRGSALVVSDDARWFKRGEADAVNLGRRGALRLLLAELVDRRLRAPGTALSMTEMIAAGWPDERIGIESAQARVYTSVQRLRALGLDGVLITRGDGYLVDPAIDVRRG
jgi:pSer/pThr/pTyr-binding forkhead associated (FHA) protein